jgi:hypothetical protein
MCLDLRFLLFDIKFQWSQISNLNFELPLQDFAQFSVQIPCFAKKPFTLL